MEIAIARGRVLRELLKQDRLEPLPIIFQLAWLVAFNDGHFDTIEPESVHTLLDEILKRVAQTSLSLDSPRQQWSSEVGEWLGDGKL